MFVKALVLVFDRSREVLPLVVTRPFYPLKKAKNVLGAINNNFLKFLPLKVLQCIGPPIVMVPLGLLKCVDVAYVS